jgi:hypothetical protein
LKLFEPIPNALKAREPEIAVLGSKAAVNRIAIQSVANISTSEGHRKWLSSA